MPGVLRPDAGIVREYAGVAEEGGRGVGPIHIGKGWSAEELSLQIREGEGAVVRVVASSGVRMSDVIAALSIRSFDKPVQLVDQNAELVAEFVSEGDSGSRIRLFRGFTDVAAAPFEGAVASALSEGRSLTIVNESDAEVLRIDAAARSVEISLEHSFGATVFRSMAGALKRIDRSEDSWGLTMNTNGNESYLSAADEFLMGLFYGRGFFDSVIEKNGQNLTIYEHDVLLGLRMTGSRTPLAERAMIERNAMLLSEKRGISRDNARDLFRRAFKHANEYEHLDEDHNSPYMAYVDSSNWHDAWDAAMRKIISYLSNQSPGLTFDAIAEIIRDQSGSEMARNDNSMEFVRIFGELPAADLQKAMLEIFMLYAPAGRSRVTGAGMGIIFRMMSVGDQKPAQHERTTVMELKRNVADAEIYIIPTDGRVVLMGDRRTSFKTPDFAVIKDGEVILVEVKWSRDGSSETNLVEKAALQLRRSRISPSVYAYIEGKGVLRGTYVRVQLFVQKVHHTYRVDLETGGSERLPDATPFVGHVGGSFRR